MPAETPTILLAGGEKDDGAGGDNASGGEGAGNGRGAGTERKDHKPSAEDSAASGRSAESNGVGKGTAATGRNNAAERLANIAKGDVNANEGSANSGEGKANATEVRADAGEAKGNAAARSTEFAERFDSSRGNAADGIANAIDNTAAAIDNAAGAVTQAAGVVEGTTAAIEGTAPEGTDTGGGDPLFGDLLNALGTGNGVAEGGTLLNFKIDGPVPLTYDELGLLGSVLDLPVMGINLLSNNADLIAQFGPPGATLNELVKATVVYQTGELLVGWDQNDADYFTAVATLLLPSPLGEALADVVNTVMFTVQPTSFYSDLYSVLFPPEVLDLIVGIGDALGGGLVAPVV